MDLGTQKPGGPMTVEVFDPPMCCSTGLCGPAMDHVLNDIHGAIGAHVLGVSGKGVLA